MMETCNQAFATDLPGWANGVTGHVSGPFGTRFYLFYES